ncbi:MAG: methylated-DNA--[protein]-cysteine S-methyltransferase [Gammaproteobacteria bacterium]
MRVFYFQSPLISLKLQSQAGAIVDVGFISQADMAEAELGGLEQRALAQLQQYCLSGQQVFDLPLEPVGTEFQQRVWRALRGIPAGEVRSYGQLAQQLGSSARAVGNACRNNPIALLIPCHRVVAKSGLGGFSGQTSGDRVTLKKRLLHHEGVEI